MDEINKLRMEIKTDFELMAIRYGTQGKKFGEMADRLEAHGQEILKQGQEIKEQGQRIAEQGERIAEQAVRLNEAHRQTARLSREVTEGQNWTEGRLRLMGERFERVLEIAEREYTTKKKRSKP